MFLGVFRKEAVAVGGFDETMHRAQDWELNTVCGQWPQIWFRRSYEVTIVRGLRSTPW